MASPSWNSGMFCSATGTTGAVDGTGSNASGTDASGSNASGTDVSGMEVVTSCVVGTLASRSVNSFSRAFCARAVSMPVPHS